MLRLSEYGWDKNKSQSTLSLLDYVKWIESICFKRIIFSEICSICKINLFCSLCTQTILQDKWRKWREREKAGWNLILIVRQHVRGNLQTGSMQLNQLKQSQTNNAIFNVLFRMTHGLWVIYMTHASYTQLLWSSSHYCQTGESDQIK